MARLPTAHSVHATLAALLTCIKRATPASCSEGLSLCVEHQHARQHRSQVRHDVVQQVEVSGTSHLCGLHSKQHKAKQQQQQQPETSNELAAQCLRTALHFVNPAHCAQGDSAQLIVGLSLQMNGLLYCSVRPAANLWMRLHAASAGIAIGWPWTSGQLTHSYNEPPAIPSASCVIFLSPPTLLHANKRVPPAAAPGSPA